MALDLIVLQEVLILLLGVGMGGFITGVMVGVSSSPVAGAILPALVSGIVAGVGLFFKNPLDAQVSEILKVWSGDEVKASPPPKRRSEEAQTRKTAPDPNLPTKREAVLEELCRLNNQRRGMPRAVGLFLIFFFAFYAVGLFAGDKLRFENESVKEPLVLTEALKKCKTVSEAYRSMRLYRDFQSQGISESVISGILTLPDYEPVKSEPTTPPLAPGPTATPPPQIAQQTPPNWIYFNPAPVPTPPKNPAIINKLPAPTSPFNKLAAPTPSAKNPDRMTGLTPPGSH